MDLSNLKPAKGAVRVNLRLGRGQGSARGGTSARGTKGQQSRSGYSRKIGFEGGQQPLQRRIPKFGFKNFNKIQYRAVNIDTLQQIAENEKTDKITPAVLVQTGLTSPNDLVKILGRGKLENKLEISAHAFSGTARKAIENQGGSALIIGAPDSYRVAPVVKSQKPGAETIVARKPKPKTEHKTEKKAAAMKKPAAKKKQ